MGNVSPVCAAVKVWRLCEEYTQEFKAIRVEAARESPAAVYPTEAEESERPLKEFREMLADSEHHTVLGAFHDRRLIGIAGLKREGFEKLRHTAILWGVYVKPDYRGRGIGRRLVAAVLTVARAMPDVCQVKLCVHAGNQVARRVYEAEGFRRYGTEPNVIRMGNQAIDENRFIARVK